MRALTVATVAAAAFALTSELEGGLKEAGALADPNRAMHGVNQSTYDKYRDEWRQPRRDVALIEPAELEQIEESYWNKGQCPAVAGVSPALALAHYDAVYNGGGIVLLQRTAGIRPDSQPIGPTTFQLLARAVSGAGEEAVVSAYCQNRLSRFQLLPEWPEDGPGWSRRMNELAAFLQIAWRVS